MNNRPEQKKLLSALGIPAAVLLSYISAVCALPASGILTALPFPAILAVVISLLCKQRKIIYTSMAVMHFFCALLFGYDMKRGLLSALTAVIASYFALLAKRAFLTVFRSKSSEAVKKSKAVLVLALAASLAVWLVCLGNPFSLIAAEKDNKSFAADCYGDAVDTGSTFFDLLRFEYVTEITFDQADAGKKYYISADKTDDYKAFYLSEAILDASDFFSGQTALPTDCISCYIDGDMFVPDNAKNREAFLPYCEYLVERTEAVTGMDGFMALYDSLMTYAEQSGTLTYKSIVLTASGMDGRKYYAYKEYGKDVVFSVDNKELEKESSEKFN